MIYKIFISEACIPMRSSGHKAAPDMTGGRQVMISVVAESSERRVASKVASDLPDIRTCGTFTSVRIFPFALSGSAASRFACIGIPTLTAVNVSRQTTDRGVSVQKGYDVGILLF